VAKTSTAAGSLVLIYQGLEEENLDQKSPGPPGWGLVQRGSSSLFIKKTRNAKKKPTTKPRKSDGVRLNCTSSFENAPCFRVLFSTDIDTIHGASHQGANRFNVFHTQ
jgi:hypothetical protein